jgi:hypothetical protein
MLEAAPRPKSHWYVNATKGPLNWYQVMRAKTGLSSKQLRRLRMLSYGIIVTYDDIGLSAKDTWHYVSTLRKRLPWLVIKPVRGMGHIVPEADLPELKRFLELDNDR